MKFALDCGFDWPGYKTIDAFNHLNRGDARWLPLDGQAEVIVVRRVFEKLSGQQIEGFLADIEQSLKPGGLFTLIVMDHDPAMEAWIAQKVTEDKLFGPKGLGHPRHVTKYSKDKLIEIVTEYGFKFVGDDTTDPVEYPAFHLLFEKKSPKAAWQYLNLEKRGGRVLEIGPGNSPWECSTDFVDVDPSKLDAIKTDGVKLRKNIDSGLSEFKDKEFDYVLCSHVLEHITKPEFVCAELSRIAKAGVIIAPSRYKEFLFGFEETDHLWDLRVKPCIDADYLIFTERYPDNPIYGLMRHPDYQSIMAGFYRTGRFDLRERRYLRNWFERTEPQLDTVYHWVDSIKMGLESER